MSNMKPFIRYKFPFHPIFCLQKHLNIFTDISHQLYLGYSLPPELLSDIPTEVASSATQSFLLSKLDILHLFKVLNEVMLSNSTVLEIQQIFQNSSASIILLNSEREVFFEDHEFLSTQKGKELYATQVCFSPNDLDNIKNLQNTLPSLVLTNKYPLQSVHIASSTYFCDPKLLTVKVDKSIKVEVEITIKDDIISPLNKKLLMIEYSYRTHNEDNSFVQGLTVLFIIENKGELNNSTLITYDAMPLIEEKFKQIYDAIFSTSLYPATSKFTKINTKSVPIINANKKDPSPLIEPTLDEDGTPLYKFRF